jgi:hypothetical protein
MLCFPLLAGVSGIREFQRGVLELESGQERFVVLGVGQLSFYLVFSYNDLCRNGFAQVAVNVTCTLGSVPLHTTL